MWVKSTYSNPSGNCPEWFTSDFTGPNGNCVQFGTGCSSANCVETEMTEGGKFVLVRDSKENGRADQTVMKYWADTWNGGKAVQFRRIDSQLVPEHLRAVQAGRKGAEATDEWYVVQRDIQRLYFDADEVAAFRRAIEEASWAPVPA